MVLIRSSKIKPKLLKGSITEVVVALLIFSFIVVLGISTLIRLNLSPVLRAKNFASEVISKEMAQTLMNRDFIDKEEPVEGFTLTRTISSEKNESIVQILVEVTNKEGVVLGSEQLVIINPISGFE